MNRKLVIAPLLMVAACDSSPTVEAENATIQEVAEKVRDANGGDVLVVRPGLWESQVELESIDIPGMPPQAVEGMKKAMASAVSGHRSCLTAEQARRPSEDFFAGAEGNCRYDKFSMAGGKMTGTMRCGGPRGGTQIIQFDGNYQAEQYEMRMASTVEGASAAGPMKMVMRMQSRRVSDCEENASSAASN